jgi:hypothetical protein
MTAFLADGFARYDVVHCGAYIYYPVDGTCVDGGQAFSVDDALEYKKDDVRYRRLSAAAFMVADFLVCLLKLFAVSGVVCGIWVFCLSSRSWPWRLETRAVPPLSLALYSRRGEYREYQNFPDMDSPCRSRK